MQIDGHIKRLSDKTFLVKPLANCPRAQQDPSNRH